MERHNGFIHLSGESIPYGMRANRTYGVGRVCRIETCDVVLSRYNYTVTCWDHTPSHKRVPPIRGKRNDAKRLGV